MGRSIRTVLLLALLAASCRRGERADDAPPVERDDATAKPAAVPAAPAVLPGEIATPALPSAGSPELAASAGGLVFMSWLEPGIDAPALRFSVIQSGEWSMPRTVTTGSLVVNWADRPSVVPWGDGRLAAHWLELAEGGGEAYGVRVATSGDGGRTWGAAMTPHGDGTATEHGFVSLVDTALGLGVAWLDGREQAAGEGHGHGGDMQLRWTNVDASGTVTAAETLLDPRVCDCCPTAAANVGGTVVVAYRDRSPEEVRDISVVRRVEGQWGEPTSVHVDGWKVEGCPVNGPALAVAGNTLAAAWHTLAGDTARVKVAFSTDAGGTWSDAVQADDGSPVGRTDLAAMADGSFALGWIEGGGTEASFRVRRVSPAGVGPSQVIAPVSSGRDSGYPRLVRNGDVLLVAFMDTAGGEPLLRTARVPPPGP